MSKLEETIQFSINKGLIWLSKNQNEDGSFGELYPITTTALAILAFTKHSHLLSTYPLDDTYMFYQCVDNALKYIFENANVCECGIYFDDFGNINMPTGVVLGALSVCAYEDFIVAYNEYLPINGYTIKQLKSEILNYLQSSQNENGGWGESNKTSDILSNNITTGYVSLGILLEQKHGYNFPQSLIDGLENWLASIQNTNGGAGNHSYKGDFSILSTGFLIEEMYILNYLKSNNRLKKAKQFIANNWRKPAGYSNTGWNSYPVSDYQATFATTLGLSLFNTDYIKTSDNICIYWNREILRSLLYQQNIDGSWSASKINFEQSDQSLSSIWAILTLEYMLSTNI